MTTENKISLENSLHVRHLLTFNISKRMFWRKPDKEKERFYLLAGMGGRALRRKRKIILIWSILAGAVVSFIVAISLYFVNTRR